MVKREKIELVKRQRIFVGIDIAGSKHRARFIDNMGEEQIKPLSFFNDREGLEKLERRVNEIPRIGDDIIFGLEPTGDYWKPVAQYLREKGYPVVLINPYHLKRTKEIIDNSQDKTDDKDSYLIADLTKQSKYFFPVIPEGVYAELREVSINWKRTSQQVARLKCHLSNFLAKYFPEYKGIFSDILGKTSLYILKHFPLPEDIERLGINKLYRVMKKVSKGSIKEGKIQLLYEKARTSIGLKGGSQTAKVLLKEVLSDIEILKKRKEKLTKMMDELLYQSGYLKNLLSIPGVGIVTGSFFLGEIGDPDNYERASQIEKMAGLNLVENSSGAMKGEKKISKRGRSALRYVGHLVATVAIGKSPEIKALYRYKVEECKKEKMKALTGLSAKMLRIMFAVCKNKTFYKHEEITRYFR